MAKVHEWFDEEIDAAVSSFRTAIVPVKLKKRKKDKKRKQKRGNK